MKNKFSTFFTDTSNRSRNLKVNLYISYFSKILTLGITFLIVPLTIHYVNSTNYGIWLTLSSIVSWFSFFDIGFGNGMRNRFSEARAENNMEKARTYVSTTYIIVFAIFSFIWMLFFLLNFFLDWSSILNAPASMRDELFNITLIVISCFCLQMVLRLITTVLIADQKAGIASIIEMISQISTFLLIIVLKEFTKGSLIILSLALSIPPILTYLITSAYFFSKEYKKFIPKLSFFDRSVVQDIFLLGSKFFVTQMAMLIVYATSNIIITQNLDPKDVTVYNIAYKYFSVVIIIFSIMMPTLWSAFTEAWATKDVNWISKSLRKMIKTWLYFCILSIVMLFISKFLYKAWVGDKIIIPYTLSFLLAVFCMISNWNSIWGNFLNGVGKIKLQTYISVMKCIIYFPLAIWLVKTMGLPGISLSFIFINLPDAILYPIQARKILKFKAKGLWNS